MSEWEMIDNKYNEMRWDGSKKWYNWNNTRKDGEEEGKARWKMKNRKQVATKSTTFIFVYLVGKQKKEYGEYEKY